MKKLGSILLVVALLCTALPANCFAAGKEFTDVPANAWYYNDVKNAVDKGLINGKTATSYAPEDNLTYAEAVKLAACMYKLSTEGNVDFEQSSPWYMTFVEYAKANNIILKDYDWENKATRAEYMDIFSKALPSEKLNEVNSVPDNAIPDVPMTHPSAPSIYKMYRAGIVQGSDAQYSCKPADNIKRSEVAAILTRMMDTNARRSFTITIPEYRTLFNTGYAPYDSKINEYYQAMNADDNAFDAGDWSSINNLMVHYARGNYGELGKLYYSLYDIDKNGVPELIFSNGTHFIDIYSLNNGSLIKLFENCCFGERSHLHVLTDGTLLTEGSSGASTSSYGTHKLGGNGSLESTGAYYFNTNGPDAYMKGYTYISLNEYTDKVSNYISHSIFNSLDWKLFADMNEIIQERCYNSATISMTNGDYLSAAEQFLKAGNYKDASNMVLECYYLYGKKQMELNYTTEGLEYLSKCRGYKDTDEIIQSYYYEEGTEAFEELIASFSQRTFTWVVDNAHEDAVKKLTLCEGYKDSTRLLDIAEKLYYAWTEMSYESNFEASLNEMSVSITGDNITITKDGFMSGNDGDLTLKLNTKQQGFTADIKGVFASSMRNFSEVNVLCALITLFTDIEKTDDLANRLKDAGEWSIGDDTQSFSINYGGYKIDIDVEENDRYDIDCSISVNKSGSSTKTNTSTKTNASTNTTVQKSAKEEPLVETPPVVEVPKAETQEYDYERICNYCNHNDGTVNMTLKNGVKTDVKWNCSSCSKENWNYVTLNW